MSTKQRTLINEPILSGLQINGELVVWNDRHLDFAALHSGYITAPDERTGWPSPCRPASWCSICWPATVDR
jgi:hypothetical protein